MARTEDQNAGLTALSPANTACETVAAGWALGIDCYRSPDRAGLQDGA